MKSCIRQGARFAHAENNVSVRISLGTVLFSNAMRVAHRRTNGAVHTSVW